MKIYNEKDVRRKSWCIDIDQVFGSPCVIAKDTHTGDYICRIVRFTDGKIGICSKVEEVLRKKGYDPFEYSNKFKHDGSIDVEFV